jgi:murein L,D-transpeptidase YafK
MVRTLRGGLLLVLVVSAASVFVTAGPVAAQSLFDLSLREAVVHGRPVTLPVSAASSGRAAAARFNAGFLETQLRHRRVAAARVETRFAMQQLFEAQGAVLGRSEIVIRVFKRERELELWARSVVDGRFVLVKSFPVCAVGNEPGPKQREGDNRTPEGYYRIAGFNPLSTYHLSLLIDYPNRADRARGRAATPALGSDIYIHGDCVTAGCVAITDDGISELYWVAAESYAAGQKDIPVHIFPFRLTAGALATAERVFAGEPELLGFWRSLEPGYRFFERTRQLPEIRSDSRGYYLLGRSLTDRPAEDDGGEALGDP